MVFPTNALFLDGKEEKKNNSTECLAAPGSRINTFKRRVLLVPVSGQTVEWIRELA